MTELEIQGPAPNGGRARIERLLAASRLFRGTDPAFVRSLADVTNPVRVPRGGRVWTRGQTAEHFHQVTRGVLELQRATAGAEPTLVAFFGPGEFPAVPVGLERRPFIADAVASTAELEVLRIPAHPVLERLEHDAVLATGMRRLLLDHARLLHSKIDVLTAGPIPKRIAVFLLDLADRFGDEREDGSTAIPLALSRAQIAKYVDARVETVIRCFSGWRREGLLVLEPEATVLPSPERLRAKLTDEG